MTRRPERLLIDGPAGQIEIVVDQPSGVPTEGAAKAAGGPAAGAACGPAAGAARGPAAGAARGLALVAHPHPLFGGSLDNKVAQTLARAFTELGYVAIRPNFRGVGGSAGVYDHGIGETDDLVRIVEWGQDRFGPLPIALAGFSFGAYVQTRVAQRVKPERMALVGVADGLVSGGRTYQAERVPPDTIVIHGELDDTVSLANVLDWARPQELPVVVVPGADHFFHRRLHLLRNIIKGQWRA